MSEEFVHNCQALNCKVEVPPKLLFCGPHWAMTPRDIQRLIWRHYRVGQEIDKRPSADYMAVMKQAIEAVRQAEELKRTGTAGQAVR